MLDMAGKVWARVQEFMKKVDDLDRKQQRTDREVAHVRQELDLIQKEMKHVDKIEAHHAREIAALEQRVKKLESEKHGLAVKAGKAKAKAARLELRGKQ
jgi:hypothetical protein